MADKIRSWANSINQNPPTDEGTVRKLYDDFAREYNDTLDGWNYSAPDVAADYLSRFIAPTKPVLDAGCGTGLTGAALARAGYQKIVGTDLSPKSVETALETRFYQAVHEHNLSDPLPFESGQFGGVLCVGVLSYIADLEPVLREFLRIIEPGGALVFTQREDLYRDRDCAQLFQQLQQELNFVRQVATEARPYLPGNPNFEGRIGVHYFVWQKPQSE